MTHTKTFLCLSVAGLLLAAMADSASALTKIYGRGSSAGRQLVGSTPSSNTFCLSSPTPKAYINSAVLTTVVDGNTVQDFSGIAQVTWVCNVTYSIPGLGITITNEPAQIFYHSQESQNGWTVLTGQYGDPTTIDAIDPANPGTACDDSPGVEHTVIAANSGQVSYFAYGGCTVTPAFATANYGASDVRSTSFNQQGPLGTFAPPGGVPIDVSNISDESAAILPFGLFVSQNVRKRNADGTVGGPLTNLTRRQIRAILQRDVRDWSAFGYGVTTDDTYTAFDSNSGITLCRRIAGSGTLATLSVTLYPELPSVDGAANGTGGKVIYRGSSSTLATDCFNETATGQSRRDIGYLNAETILTRPHTRVTIEGVDANLPNDPGFVPTAGQDRDFDRKTNIACGRYDYWDEWRITRKTSGEGSNENNMIRALADNIANHVELAIPSGAFWPRLADMKVTKSSGDATPLNWIKSGGVVPAHPECTRG